MRSRWFAVLGFVLASVLDVKLRADIIAWPREEALQEPAGCLLRSSLCGFKTRKGFKSTLKFGESEFHLGSDSILTRLDSQNYVLLKGEFLGQRMDGLKLSSEFGEVSFQEAEVYVIRQPQRILVRVLKGAARLHPRGSEQSLHLPEGYENWLGPVGSQRQAQVGVPNAIDLRDHIQRYGRVFAGTREEYRKEIRRTQITWREAIESTRSLHQNLAERQIASDVEEAGRKDRSRRAYEAETRRIREMALDRLER